MPTKARREKEVKLKAAREETARESAKFMSNRPEKKNNLGSNLTDQQPPEPHWNLRGGLRESDGQGNYLASSSIGQGGSARTAARNKRIEELKTLYPKQWGEKGKGSYIALRETKAGRPIKARTIQKYFKEK